MNELATYIFLLTKKASTICLSLYKSYIYICVCVCQGGGSNVSPVCVSPVVCVMCSRLLCPYLVCFLFSSDVIMS